MMSPPLERLMAGSPGLAGRVVGLFPALYSAPKSWRTNSLGTEVIYHFSPFSLSFFFTPGDGWVILLHTPGFSLQPPLAICELCHHGGLTGPCWGQPLQAPQASSCASVWEGITAMAELAAAPGQRCLHKIFTVCPKTALGRSQGAD